LYSSTDCIVAGTRGRFELQAIYLYVASSIAADRAGALELVYNLRDRRSPHAKQFRKDILCYWQQVALDVVVQMQEPPSYAPVHRMERITGGGLLQLCYQCASEDLDHSSTCCAATKG
jgi:hypothetical protein